MSPRTAAILAGGAVGTLSRYGMAELLGAAPGTWPWSTLLVNVVGSFILGFLTAATEADSVLRPLVGVGFCGALTTFSSFQVETLRLADAGRPELAVAYSAVSLAAGVAAALLGRRLAA
jgi:CrcB protein